jgi:FAD/FMN-containing dehydrogenase
VIAEQLARIVGAEHVLTGDLAAGYQVDWSRRFGGPSLCAVRPGSTAQVSAVMAALHQAQVPVVPQGGNTGLVGGGVPGPSGPAPVIVSLGRLNWLDPVDDLSGQVSVGAGATLAAVQRHASTAGWQYGVDLAARDTATIGGTVATNAGGIRVIAYGMTRAHVVGIEAVLADGTIVSHMQGLAKDNTGYDLVGLLCGSEGTLAVVTAVRLRLLRPHPPTTVGMIGVANYADALALMAQARGSGTLLAAEVIDAVGMDLAMQVAGLPWPLQRPHRLVVLLEAADGGDASGLPFTEQDDAVVAFDARDQGRLWEYRERQSEAFSSLGVIHKLDVSVPLPRLAACAEELADLVGSYPQATAFGVFGHLGDGNIHVEIAGPDPDDLLIDRAVLAHVAAYGGSISAEHGVGRAKAADLQLCRPVEQIAAMRAIKSALDPQGLLNPGVIFA